MASVQDLFSVLDTRTILLCAFVFLIVYFLFSQRKGLPPGPWGLPIIGVLPALARTVWRGSEPHDLFCEYAKTYGPIFRISVFNKTVVVLNDLASVKDAFQNPNLNDRPNVFLAAVLKSPGVATTSGELWLELRRFSMTVLRSLGVGKSTFEEQIAAEADEVVKELVNLHGKPSSPKPLLGNAVSNVICSVIFGKRYEYTDKAFRRLLQLLARNFKLLGSAGALNFFPNLRYLPFVKTDELLKNFKEIRQFILDIVETHRANLESDNLKDFTDVFLNQVKEHSGDQNGVSASTTRSYSLMNEGNLVGTIANLFAAGTETTATTLEWCILYMMNYPDIQKRVQDEIDEVVGRNRMPRLSDKPELNYTQAVIWEVQRLNIITPLGIPHVAATDTKIHGFVIPKGAFLVANLWALSRDPIAWSAPEEFNPGRFLNQEGTASKAEELIPFSTGRRSCIGEHLAKMEIFIFFTYFMHQFTFKKPANSPPLNLKGKGGITYSPIPYDACAIKRD